MIVSVRGTAYRSGGGGQSAEGGRRPLRATGTTADAKITPKREERGLIMEIHRAKRKRTGYENDRNHTKAIRDKYGASNIAMRKAPRREDGTMPRRVAAFALLLAVCLWGGRAAADKIPELLEVPGYLETLDEKTFKFFSLQRRLLTKQIARVKPKVAEYNRRCANFKKDSPTARWCAQNGPSLSSRYHAAAGAATKFNDRVRVQKRFVAAALDGFRAYDRGDWDEAVRHYELALSYAPGNAIMQTALDRASEKLRRQLGVPESFPIEFLPPRVAPTSQDVREEALAQLESADCHTREALASLTAAHRESTAWVARKAFDTPGIRAKCGAPPVLLTPPAPEVPEILRQDPIWRGLEAAVQTFQAAWDSQQKKIDDLSEQLERMKKATFVAGKEEKEERLFMEIHRAEGKRDDYKKDRINAEFFRDKYGSSIVEMNRVPPN